MNSSVILIVNPTSGTFSEKKLKASIELLKKRYKEVSLLYTKKRGNAEMIAKDAIQHSPEMILVVGGDGTFNEVANSAAYSEVPIALIPSGTSNVFAREVSIPDDIYKATIRAMNGRPEYINLGSINHRFFVSMAGIGFDGEVVYGLSQQVKRLSGKGAHLLSGIKVLTGYHPERLKIVIDEKGYEGYGLIVCNAKNYAGSFRVCPEADIYSLDLSAFIMHGGKRRDLLKYVTGIIRGTHLNLNNVTFRRGNRISVSKGAHIQIDGDYFGMSPAVITCRERALRIIK